MPEATLHNKDSGFMKRQSKMWNSFWLRTSILTAFTIAYILMLLAVVLLYYFSKQNNGLGSQKESYHYAWTYGPTAGLSARLALIISSFLTLVVLTLALAFWKKVDFATKKLSPWQNLRNGPAPATTTILLDYISPTFPLTFVQAFKNKHYSVLVSAVGIILLKLTIVFSTGLLVLEPTSLTRNASMIVHSDFLVGNELFDISTIGTRTGALYYGIGSQGLQFPLGTSGDVAVPVFETIGSHAAATTFSAEVEGFKTLLDCESLPTINETTGMVSAPWLSKNGFTFAANISTPTCNLTNIIVAQGDSHGWDGDTEPTEGFQGRLRNYTCNDGVDNSLFVNSTSEYRSRFEEHRVLMAMTNLQWTFFHMIPPEPGVLQRSPVNGMWVKNITAVLCKPSYEIETFAVTYAEARNASTDPVDAVQISESSRQLDSFQLADLGSAVVQAMAIMNLALGIGEEDYVMSPIVPAFFQLLAAMNNNSRQEAFLDPALLLGLGSEAFKGVMTQISRIYLMQSANSTLSGSVTYNESRLMVKSISVISMAVSLGLLALASLLLIVVRPWDVAPREPDSIAASATFLAASPELVSALMDLGAARTSKITREVSGKAFQSRQITGVQPKFVLEPILTAETLHRSPRVDKIPALKWWRPIATRGYFLILATTTPLLILAVLEILQHLSDTRSGIADISVKSRSLSRSVVSYLPALLMLGIATLYSTIESTFAIITPFAALRRRDHSAWARIHQTPLGMLSPRALISSIRWRCPGYFSAVVGALLASFLTIIVSGLYSPAYVLATQRILLEQADDFNLSLMTTVMQDGAGGAITSLIEYSNLTDPAWTYDTLAFRRLSTPADVKLGKIITSATGVVDVTLPGIMSTLNCTAFSTDASTTKIISLPSVEAAGCVPFEVDTFLSWPCERKGQSSDEKDSGYWRQKFWLSNETDRPTYIGGAVPLSWLTATGDDIVDGSGVYGTSSNTDDPAGDGSKYMSAMAYTDMRNDGCPDFGITLGTAAISHPNGNESEWEVEGNFTRLICFMNVQEVDTALHLNMPDLSINRTYPMSPKKETRRLIKNGTSTIWDLNLNQFLLSLDSFKDFGVDEAVLSPEDTPIVHNMDPFTLMLVLGKDKVPIADLLGDENVDNLAAAANHLYGRYMAQAISSKIRAPLASGTTTPTYNGTLSDPTARLRIKQNKGPKIALQVLLGILSLSALCVWIDNRGTAAEVLPHNPCSIAGIMTLLADSELVSRENIPAGAEWKNDQELEEAGVFSGLSVRMGWRNVPSGGDTEQHEGKGKFGIYVAENVIKS